MIQTLLCKILKIQILLSVGISVALAESTPMAAAKNSESMRLLTGKIEKITAKLNQDQDSQSQAHKQLQNIEKKIDQLVRRKRKSEQQISQLKADLISLEHQQNRLTRQLGREQQVLAKQIRAEYSLGRHYPLKLVLTAQDPKVISRNITYLHHFNQIAASRLKSLNNDIREIDRLESAIKEQSVELQASRGRYSKQKTKLESEFKKRNSLLTKLDISIREKRSALQQLQIDQKRLQKLLGVLKMPDTTTAKPIAPEPVTNFAYLKGKLPWPVINRSEIVKRGHGLVIHTEEGQPIHATAAGTVVFADWLRGYGLLVIVDHGDEYMTLYGYNQSLNKQLNDTVNSGEMIATSGRSGGHMHAGLYFEVRHQGRPHDPLSWMVK